MINSVAIQRLLEAAIMFKLERGNRATIGRPEAAQSASTKAMAPPVLMQSGPLKQIFVRHNGWNNPPIISPEDTASVAIAIAATARETAIAPLAYRESMADAAQPARLPEPATALASQIPAPVQYASAELALALAAKSPLSIFRLNAAKTAKSDDAIARPTPSADQADKRRKVIAAAIICGTILLVAVLIFAMLI